MSVVTIEFLSRASRPGESEPLFCLRLGFPTQPCLILFSNVTEDEIRIRENTMNIERTFRTDHLPPLSAKFRRKAEIFRRRAREALTRPDREISTIELLFLGKTCSVLYLWDELWALAQIAIKQYPNWSEGHLWRCEVLATAGGNPDELERCVTDLLVCDPENSLGWAMMAVVASLRGKRPGVRLFLEKALALDPENHGIYLNLAQWYLEEGELIQALALAHKSIALSTKSAKARKIVATCLAELERRG